MSRPRHRDPSGGNPARPALSATRTDNASQAGGPDITASSEPSFGTQVQARTAALAFAPLCVRVLVASRMLGVGKTTVYDLIESGEIDTIKIGRATLVTVASLQDFVVRRVEQAHNR